VHNPNASTVGPILANLTFATILRQTVFNGPNELSTFVPFSRNFQNIITLITFLFYNTKISDNIAESGKVPRMLAAFLR
jgi:hypothetical protein